MLIVIPEKIIITMVKMVVMITAAFPFLIVYKAGKIKKSKIYQVGTSSNILVCIELASTDAHSSKVKNKEIANNIIKRFPKNLPTAPQ